MAYDDEIRPTVELRERPVLYTHDKRPIYRQIGFAARGMQTTATFPALSEPRRKPKGKGKGK